MAYALAMMNSLGRRTRRFAAALWLLGMVVCQASAQTLAVAADSSLIDVMNALARDFESRHKGVTVSLLPGPTGTLLEQMARGAPADLLTSPDAETVRLGVQRRLLVTGLPGFFATNTLVLVVPASLNLPVQRLSDLSRPEVTRIAMGRPATAASGRFAREAINAQRLWPALQRKLVFADDVREVLALVSGASVEAGFIYGTDLPAAAGRVRLVETLPTSTPIRYLANVATGSKQPELARAFIDHLRSEPARAIFSRHGFGLP
jgi:molybdate transport system substrate-binding protein